MMIVFLWNDLPNSVKNLQHHQQLNPIALRKAKIAYSFGLSECSRVTMAVKSHFLDSINL